MGTRASSMEPGTRVQILTVLPASFVTQQVAFPLCSRFFLFRMRILTLLTPLREGQEEPMHVKTLWKA